MKSPAMHYHPKGSTGRGTICGRTLLGKKPNYTTHRKEVTCQRCLAKLDVTEVERAISTIERSAKTKATKRVLVVDKKAIKSLEKVVKHIRAYLHLVVGGRDNIRVKDGRAILTATHDLLRDERDGWSDLNLTKRQRAEEMHIAGVDTRRFE